MTFEIHGSAAEDACINVVLRRSAQRMAVCHFHVATGISPLPTLPTLRILVMRNVMINPLVVESILSAPGLGTVTHLTLDGLIGDDEMWHEYYFPNSHVF